MIKIAVIGDVILDKYTFGIVERLNPEAPVPLLDVQKEEYKPGGAGNVAANLAELGAEVHLFGVAGSDYNRHLLDETLKQYKIISFILTDNTRPTTVKQRIIAHNQQLARVDYEKKENINGSHLEEIKKNMSKYDAIIISDYAKGMISSKLIDHIKTLNTPIFVDPKPKNKGLYKGVFCLTPNIKEVKEMTYLNDDLKAAKKLSEELNSSVLLTRSEKGIALYELGEKEFLLDAKKRDVTDVTGAGDTVIATLAYFYSKGSSLRESSIYANLAASIAVSHVGCYQVKLAEILDAEQKFSEKQKK
jgi:D-glycero-beta-D-manno-heptose-7-phosphate kinase